MADNKRLLKTALIISMALLLLCIAACVGTSYAWFTDQVSSQRNTIQVGTLDVELDFSHSGNDNDWHPLLRNSNTFRDDDSWLPGHSQHVYLRIRNNGSLALKYEFSLNVLEETGTINMLGENYELSQYLTVGHAEGVTAPGLVVTEGNAFLSHVNKLTADDQQSDIAIVKGELEPGASRIETLVVRMPANLDKEINFPNTVNPPQLTFGLDVVATQASKESDAFGDDYDINAEFPAIGSPALLEKLKQEGWNN